MPKQNFFSVLNNTIRGGIFTVLMILASVFYGTFTALLYPVLPFRYRYRLIMAWTLAITALLKYLCGVKYRVEGLENIPKDHAYIVLSKHQSTWETFYLPHLFHHTAIILKRSLLWLPFFGWGLATINPIAINRADGSSAMQQIIRKGKKYLDDGRCILIFPEGTRIPPGQIGKYRLGGARLAVATGYPIVPVAHNAGECWPKRGVRKYPGTVTVVIGQPIPTEGQTAEAVLAKTQEWIENTMLRINGTI